MIGEADPRAFKYSAFISYSHRDTDFARRLQRRLESYRLPRRLRGLGSAGGGKLGPCFRDRDELRASADLSDAVRHALADSGFLIVICSPSAAASEWVGQEIDYFRELRGDNAIVAVLPDDAATATFHPALLRAKADGHPLNPLAADFRRHGDGRRLALLKIVAAITDVSLDELIHRHTQRQIRSITLIAAGALVVAIAMGLVSIVALAERSNAIRERDRSANLVESMLTQLRGKLKSAGRLDLLDAVNQIALQYYHGQQLNDLTLKALIDRAKLLQAIGEDDEERGDPTAAAPQFAEAKRITAALLTTHPRDPAVIFADAQSEYWLATIDADDGHTDSEKRHFLNYATLADRLVALDPTKPDWQTEVGYANSNLGTLVLRQTIDAAGARAYFTKSLSAFLLASRKSPGDSDLKSQIADGYGWLADAEKFQGDYGDAETNRDRQRQILTELSRSDPNDATYQRMVVSNTLGLARIALLRHDWETTMELLKQDEILAHQHVIADPEDVNLAREGRAIQLFEVETWLSMPVGARPSQLVTSQKIGNCEAEWSKANNRELASFCFVLRERQLADDKDRAGALQLASAHPVGTRPGEPVLSERWLIDLSAEAVLPQR